MPIEELIKWESKSLFKLFLRRIGFKSHAEYVALFGADLQKREETVKRFLETYPNLSK